MIKCHSVLKQREKKKAQKNNYVAESRKDECDVCARVSQGKAENTAVSVFGGNGCFSRDSLR